MLQPGKLLVGRHVPGCYTRDRWTHACSPLRLRPAQGLGAALDLAERDTYLFLWSAVSLVDALSFGGKKKGADGGIDGLIYAAQPGF